MKDSVQRSRGSSGRLVLRFGPCVLLMGAIFAFSSRTGNDLNSWLPFFQRFIPGMQGFDWGHFVAYFCLGLTYLWAIADESPSLSRKLLVILLCLLYGMTDEFHQLYVPGRASDPADLRNDGIGAALAMLIISIPSLAKLYRTLPHARKY